MAEVQDKLKETTTQRKKIIKANKQMDLLEYFPFFYSHPQLVSFRYKYTLHIVMQILNYHNILLSAQSEYFKWFISIIYFCI